MGTNSFHAPGQGSRKAVPGVESIVREGRSKRKMRWWVVTFLLALFGGFVADYLLYPLAPIGGHTRDQGKNGLWLRFTWYFGEKSDREVRALAADLRARNIRYAYFHVRSIESGGRLKYRYPKQAQNLTDSIRRAAPEIRQLAWIYAGNMQGQGQVVLANDRVRKRMVDEAVWLTTVCGFDGVQWDYEICPDGDLSFLKLLDETRAALAQSKILSVAAECSYPGLLARHGWSDSYIGEVAKRTDQLAVMCYDSGMVTPRLYVWFVQRQASVIPHVAHRANPGCEVIFGLPTYGQAGKSHNPQAENLRLALKAVREADSSPDGLALFADYTTDDREWATYDRYWLGNGALKPRPRR